MRKKLKTKGSLQSVIGLEISVEGANVRIDSFACKSIKVNMAAACAVHNLLSQWFRLR